jgi:hypothetical protein
MSKTETTFTDADAMAFGEKLKEAIDEAEKRKIPADRALPMALAAFCDWFECTPDQFLEAVQDGISISQKWGMQNLAEDGSCQTRQ